MTFEEFQKQVSSIETLLAGMAKGLPLTFEGLNYSLEACECAAQILGCDPTTAKMCNAKFREDTLKVSLEMARAA